ncbi:MAG: Hsp20/alpha crystallin family protein [Bacilli bacterium]|nr:Hsp20/alpha crystallin family protein [Bacilli bacterium]
MRNRKGELVLHDPFFDDFFPLDLFKTDWPDIRRHGAMKADIVAKDNHYEVVVDMPGVAKENVEISLENGYLSIKAEQKSESKDENENYIHRERYYQSACRSFYVGDGVEEKDISAKLENGVLTVSIPKEKRKVEPKRMIEIQ